MRARSTRPQAARHEPYPDRVAAGRSLAARLQDRTWEGEPVVLGLPRGGVPVAGEVAQALDAPLDVLLVRKLGLPAQPELAMGAIAGVGGAVEMVRNETLIARLGVPDHVLEQVAREESVELRRREEAYRQGRAAVPVTGRTALVVDDGLATGSTVRAAVAALRHRDPAAVVVAVPVGSADSCASLRDDVDEVVCAWTPHPFRAVGLAYVDFDATSDEEVREVLAAAVRRRDDDDR